MSDDVKRNAPSGVAVERVVRLFPCPFCATHRHKLVQWPVNATEWGAEVRCECGGRGPAGFGPTCESMACDLWNGREALRRAGLIGAIANADRVLEKIEAYKCAVQPNVRMSDGL